MTHHFDWGESFHRIISFAHRLVIEKLLIEKCELSEKIKLEKNKKYENDCWDSRWVIFTKSGFPGQPVPFHVSANNDNYQTVRVFRTEFDSGKTATRDVQNGRNYESGLTGFWLDLCFGPRWAKSWPIIRSTDRFKAISLTIPPRWLPVLMFGSVWTSLF